MCLVGPKLPKYGQSVVVRCLEKGDLNELYTIESDPEVKRYMGGPVRTPREEWIRGMESQLFMCITLAVLAKDNLGFAGRASVGTYGHSEVDREIQIALAKKYQRQHFGSEVCEILIHAAFEELGAERVVGVAHPENEGSLKLLRLFHFEKAGIISEQTWQREHLKFVLTRCGFQK
ncbi:MAG: GNAT family N-acetyltransferase [Verrucomicrobia bacterium]|nr:GNAT family N-acetyltransferase [Verrucomicrobiota bacterium]